MEAFTKLYDREVELIENGNELKVYNHIKKVYSRQQKASFDLQSKIEEDTKLSNKTIKRSIKKLKEVGLIKSEKRGRYNYYVLPIYDECEGNITEEIKPKEEKEMNTEETNVQIYTAPQPMSKAIPSPKVKEILDKYKKDIDNINEDLSMDKLGYEGYLEQANNRLINLRERANIDDDTFKRLCNYINYNLIRDNEVF